MGYYEKGYEEALIDLGNKIWLPRLARRNRPENSEDARRFDTGYMAAMLNMPRR